MSPVISAASAAFAVENSFPNLNTFALVATLNQPID
jgi:hypothetical protein